MLLNQVQFLNDGDIHRNSYSVPQTARGVGVEIRWLQPETSTRSTGPSFDGTRVRLPRATGRAEHQTWAPQFTIHARNPQKDIVVGGSHTVFAQVWRAFLMDYEFRPAPWRTWRL